MRPLKVNRCKNARIDDKNARIGELNPWEMAKNARIEFVENMHSTGKMTAITSSAIIAILEDLGENQVIGSQDVQKTLNCKETKALRIINEMKKAGIIVAVAGKGKGKYMELQLIVTGNTAHGKYDAD